MISPVAGLLCDIIGSHKPAASVSSQGGVKDITGGVSYNTGSCEFFRDDSTSARSTISLA